MRRISLGVLALALLTSGCARHLATTPVRNVRFLGVTENTNAAERVRALGDRIYPKIVELLGNRPSESPRRFDIVFTSLTSSNTAETRGATLYLNSDYFLRTPGKPVFWLARYPEYADIVFVHELVHVAQHYLKTNTVPSYWVEGLADYARYQLGYTNWAGPQCSAEYPHYKSGYWCAGAFLQYLDTTYGPKVIHNLNAALRNDRYSDALFADVTGKSLDSLWSEFQKSAAFSRTNQIVSTNRAVPFAVER